MKKCIISFKFLFIFVSILHSQTNYSEWNNDFNLSKNEFFIDTNYILIFEQYDQSIPEVAFGETNFFAVWTDWKDWKIKGTRITLDGIILDTNGITICPNSDSQWYSDISFDGQNYFVVWRTPDNLYGTRIDTLGTVLDPQGINISSLTYCGWPPSLVFDGTNYFVVWTDNDVYNSPTIFGLRIDPNGAIVDSSKIQISLELSYQINPALAYGGSQYLVVWEDELQQALMGARVDTSGVVLDTSEIWLSNLFGPLNPAVAFDGTNYMVIFDWGDVYGSLVDTSGTVIDMDLRLVNLNNTPIIHPDICFNQNHYLIIYRDYLSGHGIYGTRVNTSGVVIDTNGFEITNSANAKIRPNVCSDNTNYLILWQDYFSGIDWNIYGNRIDSGGSVLHSPDIRISYDDSPYKINTQKDPSLSTDGSDYLVVWEDEDSLDVYHLYGAIVDEYGIVDTCRIRISTSADSQLNPVTAFNGTNYLVAWEDFRNHPDSADIYGTRISPSGEVLDTSGIGISTSNGEKLNIKVSSDDTNYMVVWSDSRSGTKDIYGARLTGEGVLMDLNGIQISYLGPDRDQPDIAWGGNSYLVVWRIGNSPGEYNIMGTRVSSSGTVINTDEILISIAVNAQENPAVAFDGINYLVVWEDKQSGSDYDIYGCRIDTAGNILDTGGFILSSAPGDQILPSISFNGTYYYLTWEDYRNGAEADVYGVCVSPVGMIVDSFTVCSDQHDQNDPSICCNYTGNVFVVYSSFEDFIGNQYISTDRIAGNFYPFLGMEEAPGIKPVDIRYQIISSNITGDKFSILLELPSTTDIVFRVYDLSGREICNERYLSRGPGVQNIQWDLRDTRNIEVGYGQYFYQIDLGEQTISGKIILIK
ncbi:MAG: hypothetical protein APR63_06170 [Desulfuromonas sp. SDB]|nr:MAG: hypothetical protein APR63_06170 [Desulfuromonas sp. SDB]